MKSNYCKSTVHFSFVAVLMFLTACSQSLPPKLDMRFAGNHNVQILTPTNRQNMAVLGAYALGVIALKNLDIYLDIAETGTTKFPVTSGNQKQTIEQNILPSCENVTPVSSAKNGLVTYRVDSSNCGSSGTINKWTSQFSFTTDQSGKIASLNYDSSKDPSLFQYGAYPVLALNQQSTTNHQRISQTLTIPNETTASNGNTSPGESITLTNQNGIYQFSANTVMQFTYDTSNVKGQRNNQKILTATVTIQGELDRRNQTQQKIELTEFSVQYLATGPSQSQPLATGSIEIQNPQTNFIPFSNGVPVGAIPFTLTATVPKQTLTANIQSSAQSLYIKGEPGAVSLDATSSATRLNEMMAAAQYAATDVGLYTTN